MKQLYEYINETKNNVSLIAFGDVALHKKNCEYYKINNTYDFSSIISDIKPIVSKYDIAFYNQEGIIGGDLGWYGGKIENNKSHLNNPKEISDSLVNAGFNLISLSNNHTFDCGELGIKNSSEYWKNKNVITNGSWYTENDAKPSIFTKNGIKIGFISYTNKINGIYSNKWYYRNEYNTEKAKQDVAYLKSNNVDLIIVSMHWGYENDSDKNSSYICKEIPSEDQKEIAKELSNLGVNIILGTHSHYIHPIEKIKNTFVVYSLGNFIFSSKLYNELKHKVGAIVKFNIRKINNKIKIDINYDLLYIDWYENGKIKVYPFSTLSTNILPQKYSVFQYYKNILNKNLIINDNENSI